VALLEQVAKLIEASRTPVPVPPTPDATLTVRLFNGEKGSRPPKWGTVSVVGTHLQNASIKGERNGGSSGVIEFGTVPAGAYRINVRTARCETTRSVKVLQGEPHVEEFICPDDDLRQTEINIECDLPEDLKEKDIAVVALFRDEPFEFGGDTWKDSTNAGPSFAVNREGTRSLIQRVMPDLHGPPGSTRDTRANWIVNVVRGEDPSRTKATTSTSRQYWTGGRFKLTFLALATDPGRVNLGQGIGTGMGMGGALAGAHSAPASDLGRMNFKQVGLRDGVVVAAARMMKFDVNGMKGDADWPEDLDADFVVKEGQPWRIIIPDRLIEEARKQIAETPAVKLESP
jgi:hypothetical protein